MFTSLLLSAALLAPRVATPSYSPPGGSYGSTQNVTVSSKSSGATIYCTTDGSTPRRSSALRYSGAISISSTTTLKCIAYVGVNRPRSLVASATYTISGSLPDCLASELRSTGTKYYYCNCSGTGADPNCIAGDDANTPCTNPAAPCQSWSAAGSRFNSMAAGDTVALCKGGAWNVTSGVGVTNTSCAPTSETTWCEFRSYLPSWGGTAKPRINMTSNSSSVFVFNQWSGPYRGYRFWGLDIRHPADRPRGDAYDYYGSDAYTFSIANGGEPYSYVDICGNYGYAGSIFVGTNGPPNVTVRYNTIEGYGKGAVYGGGENYTIDHNTFANNGDQAISESRQGWMHTIYTYGNAGQGDPRGSKNMRITNNKFLISAEGNWGFLPTSRCHGIIAAHRGSTVESRIENNIVESHGDSACLPLFFGASGSDGVHYDAIMRNNRVLMSVGNGDGGVVASGCPSGGVVEGNVVDAPGGYGIRVPHLSGGTTAPTNGITIRNNTVRLSGSGTAYRFGYNGLGDNFIAENNVAVVPSGSTTFNVDDVNSWADGHPWSLATYNNDPTSNNVSRNYGGTGDQASIAAALFQDPNAAETFLDGVSTRDWRPILSGRLDDTGNQTYYSPYVAGPSVYWNEDDVETARTPPIDIGAFAR